MVAAAAGSTPISIITATPIKTEYRITMTPSNDHCPRGRPPGTTAEDTRTRAVVYTSERSKRSACANRRGSDYLAEGERGAHGRRAGREGQHPGGAGRANVGQAGRPASASNARARRPARSATSRTRPRPTQDGRGGNLHQAVTASGSAGDPSCATAPAMAGAMKQRREQPDGDRLAAQEHRTTAGGAASPAPSPGRPPPVQRRTRPGSLARPLRIWLARSQP